MAKAGHLVQIQDITHTRRTLLESLIILMLSSQRGEVLVNFTGDGLDLKEILRPLGPWVGDSGWIAFTLLMICPYHLMDMGAL